MNTLDIILLIPLAIAAVSGWRKGIIIQACGIAGLVLGILFAMRFNHRLGEWIDAGEKFSSLLGFIIILVVSILVLAAIGILFKKVFSLTGFGLVDNIGGLALGVVKIGFLLSMLTGYFVQMNNNYHWVKPDKITESVLYKPLQQMTDTLFPYMIKIKDKILDDQPQTEQDEVTPPTSK